MISLTLDIPESHPVFAGHFPNDPLVPGALLIDWIAGAIELALTTNIGTIKQVKFINPVRPSDQLSLHLTPKNEHYQVLVLNHETPCIKGKFFYHD